MNPYVTARLDLTLNRGVSLVMKVKVSDSNAAPVDLTGASFVLRLLRKDESEVLSFNSTTHTDRLFVTDPTTGELNVHVKPADSTALRGSFYPQLDMSWPDGTNARLIEGTWNYK